MEQEMVSFWNEIKKFEDMLSENPASYCFAQLSELYRKTGLVDDAVNTAEKGCQLLPEFVAGWLALAYAFLEKEDIGKGMDILARAVRATPENVQARNRLVRLYLESGELQRAEELLKVILSLDSDDTEAQALLETLSPRLQQPIPPVVNGTTSTPETANDDFGFSFEDDVDVQNVEEELFVLEEEDLVEELLADDTPGNGSTTEQAEPPLPSPEVPDRSEAKDPLTTGTLAELYVAQGFIDKALTIYRELLQVNPDNLAIITRIKELELILAPEVSPPELSIPEQNEVESMVNAASVVAESADDEMSAVETLQVWLDNIARRKQ